MSTKTALVLGAGIGGLSAAAQLAYHGYKVTILEKNAKAGGKVIQFKKGDFTFDGGASFITFTKIYDEWFQSIGKKRNDYIRWEKMSDTTTFYFADGKSFTLSTNAKQVRKEIADKFPGNEEGFDRYMKMAGDVWKLLYDGPNLARRNYHKLFGFDYVLDPRMALDFPKLQLLKTWKQVVEECFTSPELQMVFSYQATFIGMKPSEALGTYCFFPRAEIEDGMYQVEGGVYGIIAGFEKVCRELGVEFVFDAEVEKLLYEGSRVTGVQTKAGSFNADIVVSNIDGAWFYTNLMPPEKNKTFSADKLKKMAHTNSYFTINLGLKKPVKEFSHHTFFVAPHWQEFFDKILQPGQVKSFSFDNTCYYFLQKSHSHPWMAPKGKTSAFILIPVCGYDPGFDWNQYEDTFKNFIYDMMEQRDGIPIRSLIEEEEVYSPARWGKEFNLWENIILSFSMNFFQVNGFRMPNKAREFENLYFSGSSTIPGPGLPPCVDSGRLVVERILEDQR